MTTSVSYPSSPRQITAASAVSTSVGPTTPQLAAIVAGFLVAGVTAAVATTTDPFWWQLHFSRLGEFVDASGVLFNGSLIVSGGLIAIFARRLQRDLRRLHGRGSRAHRPRAFAAFMCLVGASLTLVGCVPLNANMFIHDRAASGLVLGFAGLLTTAPFLRGMPRTMNLATAAAGAALVVGTTLFVTTRLTLAAFEIITFATMLAWVALFTRNLARAHAAHVRRDELSDSPAPGPVAEPHAVHVASAADEPHPSHLPRRKRGALAHPAQALAHPGQSTRHPARPHGARCDARGRPRPGCTASAARAA